MSIIERVKIERIAVECYTETEAHKLESIFNGDWDSAECYDQDDDDSCFVISSIYREVIYIDADFCNENNYEIISYDDFMAEYEKEQKLDNGEPVTNELDDSAVMTKPKHLRLYETMIKCDNVYYIWTHIQGVKQIKSSKVLSINTETVYLECGECSFDFVYFTKEECQEAIDAEA